MSVTVTTSHNDSVATWWLDRPASRNAMNLEMWEELKNYHSTGEWLKYSGIETGNYQRVQYDNKAGLDLYMRRRNAQYADYQYEVEK